MRKKPEDFCNFAANFGTEGLGGLVKSTAGRDCGRFFVVVGRMDEKYILLADGALRPIEAPKKKKLKHVEDMYILSEELKERLSGREHIQNAEIRKIIKLLVSECAQAADEPEQGGK